MSKQTEALKLALEALKKSDGFLYNWHENYSDDEADAYATVRQLNDQAITAIRVALAEQPAQQEPDAIGCKCSECGKWQRWTPSGMTCKNGHGGAPGINHRLYTTPQPQAQPAREWVGLTDEQVIKTFNAICNGKPFSVERILELHRAIEAAHGITKGNT